MTWPIAILLVFIFAVLVAAVGSFVGGSRMSRHRDDTSAAMQEYYRRGGPVNPQNWYGGGAG